MQKSTHMNLKPPITAVVSLAVGMLIGRHLPGSTPAMPVDHAQHGLETRPVRFNGGSVDSTKSKPSEEPIKLPEPADPSVQAAVSPVSLEVISSLSLAAGRRKLDQDLFGGDGAVEKALEITDHEKAVIQTAWRGLLRDIRKLEAGSIRSEPIDEWSHRIVVPEMDATTVPLGNSFGKHVRDTLGAERGELFIAAKQLGRIFAEPSGERVYTVNTEETGDGEWRFRIESKGGDGARMWVGKVIPDELLHLTNAAGISSALGE